MGIAPGPLKASMSRLFPYWPRSKGPNLIGWTTMFQSLGSMKGKWEKVRVVISVVLAHSIVLDACEGPASYFHT